MVNTLEYYNENAKAFVSRTRDLELTELQDKFLNFIEPGGKILDFGCGSGRDSKYLIPGCSDRRINRICQNGFGICGD